MPRSTSIHLPPGVTLSLTSYAQKYGVDSALALAVAQVESGGNQNAVSSAGAVGIMQLEPSTFYSLKNIDGKPFTDINDPQQNMEAGVVYLAQQYDQFGDWTTALAAYNAGPGNVEKYGGVPPFAETQQYVWNVSKLAANAGSTSENLRQQNLTSSLNAATQQPENPLITPVGQSIDPNDIAAANPLSVSLQIDTGLDETPWYDMTANGKLITGNSKVRQTVQPVSFMVYLSRSQDNFLHDPHSGKPIVLQLNTSIRTFELQSKHIYNRQPSRTGMHVTFWGMAPDLITGSGSTGVFMNQFGLTDFFSVANVTDDVRQLVQSGFERTFGSNITGVQQGTSTGFVEVFNVTNSQFNNVVNKVAVDPTTAFRVAAQDAFLEFLKLFQMNGNVWFFSPNYKGSYSGQQQQAPNAWSEGLGATSFEQVARNNDVAQRGLVAMRYRNNIFLGYFKQLNWTQDAEKPFAWEFNFVFQVERTVSALYWPNAQVTQFNSVGQAFSAGIRASSGPIDIVPSAIEGTIEPNG